jgi:hypothetical protein
MDLLKLYGVYMGLQYFKVYTILTACNLDETAVRGEAMNSCLKISEQQVIRWVLVARVAMNQTFHRT